MTLWLSMEVSDYRVWHIDNKILKLAVGRTGGQINSQTNGYTRTDIKHMVG